MPKLQIVRPDGSSQDHEITEELLTIGRAPDNVFTIDDASVSSHHALIAPSGGSYILKDLGSTNGTMVNGAELKADTEYTLKPGDKILFGKVDSVFDAEHAATDAPELPSSEERNVAPASQSIKPSNFMNASPFRKTAAKKDPAGIAVLILGVVATLGALAVLLMAMQMTPS